MILAASLAGCGGAPEPDVTLESDPLIIRRPLEPACLPDLKAEWVDLGPPKDLIPSALLGACGIPVNTLAQRQVKIRNIGCAAAQGPIPWRLATNGGPFTPHGLLDGCATVGSLAPGATCAVAWADGSSMPWRLEYFFQPDPFNAIKESDETVQHLWLTAEITGPWIAGLEHPTAQVGGAVTFIGSFNQEVNTLLFEDRRLPPLIKKTVNGYHYLAFLIPPVRWGTRSLRVESECGTSLPIDFTVSPTMCGGLQGLGCPAEMTCEFGPDCNPRTGGADCSGTCVPYTRPPK